MQMPVVFAEDTAADAPVMEISEPVVKSEKVAVDEAHFPDKYFRNYISQRIDKDPDGVLS
ncbi:MAG: hypothetical protein ACI4KF_11655 [Huintestinicola sp.]